MSIDNENSLFWQSKAGKKIISYGTLLMVCGILEVIFSFIVLMIIRVQLDDSSMLMYDYFSYLFIPMVLSICSIICGLNIRRRLCSPDKLNSINIVIIILELIAIPVSGRITIFGLFILIDALCCQFNWLKEYRLWCESGIGTRQKFSQKTQDAIQVAKVVKKQNNKKEDEEDDEF